MTQACSTQKAGRPAVWAHVSNVAISIWILSCGWKLTASSVYELHFTYQSTLFLLFYLHFKQMSAWEAFFRPLKPSCLPGRASWSWCRLYTHYSHSESGFSQQQGNRIPQEQCQVFTRTHSVSCFSETKPCQMNASKKFFLKSSVIVDLVLTIPSDLSDIVSSVSWIARFIKSLQPFQVLETKKIGDKINNSLSEQSLLVQRLSVWRILHI